MIGDDVRVGEHAELELFTQSLSITTFRYVPRGLRASLGAPDAEAYLDRLNEALLERIQSGGEAFVSNAVIRGRYVLRAFVVHIITMAADVDALSEIVARLGRETDVEPRAAP